MATNITLQPGESITITAAGAIGQPEPPPITTPPPVIEQPPPIERPPNTVDLGDLKFDGSQVNSTGMTGTAVAYGRILVPNPLPAGWPGQQTYVSIFEHGAPARARRMWLSREPFDYSGHYPAYRYGNAGVNIYMKFEADDPNTVKLMTGETWYVTIKNESPDGTPSCPEGDNGNFSLRMYPPNN